MSSEEPSWVKSLSQKIGMEEMVLRVVLGIVIANVASFAYNVSWLKRSSFKMQNLYFIGIGIFISYWTFGMNCVGHHLSCILVNFIVLKMFGASLYSVSFLFVFQLGYLCVGYLMYNMTAEYAVNWTLPHCVLCLKLIGLAMDVWDGSKNLSDNEEYLDALKQVPSLLEMMGYAFFPPTYLVGTPHSMNKYQNFIRRNASGGLMIGSKTYALQRLLLAAIYMGIHIILNNTVSTDYIKSEEFQVLPFWKMSCYLVMWIKGYNSKYVSIILLAEVGSILTGISYLGTKSVGTIDWSGGGRINIQLFETCTSFRQLGTSWNTETNSWLKLTYSTFL